MNAMIKVQESNETWRFGLEPVQILQHLWLEKFEKMTCADRTKNTPAIPIIFNKLDQDWKYANEKVERSQTLFSMVLVIIAIELVVAHSRNTPSSITLLWVLRQPLDALANFLEYWVGIMCEVVHMKFNIPFTGERGMVCATYANLYKKIVDHHGTQNVNGVTRTVVLSFIVRRNVLDQSWQGEVLEPYVHVQSFTRATERHYVCIEDLSQGIDIPPKCHSLAKTLEMPETQFKTQGTDSIVKKQLMIVKLMRWLEAKDPRAKQRRFAQPNYRYSHPLIPALDSYVFRRAMQDAQGAGATIGKKMGESMIASLCHEARALYVRHEDWWPSTAITRKHARASTLFGSDKSFQQLATSNNRKCGDAWITLLHDIEPLPDDKNNQRLATKRDRSRTDLLLLRSFSMDIIERQPHL